MFDLRKLPHPNRWFKEYGDRPFSILETLEYEATVCRVKPEQTALGVANFQVKRHVTDYESGTIEYYWVLVNCGEK